MAERFQPVRTGGIVLLDDSQRQQLGDAHILPQRPPHPYENNSSSFTSSDQSGGSRVPSAVRTDFTTYQQRSTLSAQVTDFTSAGDMPNSSAFDPRLSDEDMIPTNPVAGADQFAVKSSGLIASGTNTLFGVILGLGIGSLLLHYKVPDLTAQWISLPGELFMRGITCLVLPYVFCSVAVAVGDLVYVNKMSMVGKQTIKVFSVFWLATAVMGNAIALLFRPYFSMSYEGSSAPNLIGLTCNNGGLMELQTNTSLTCSGTEVPGNTLSATGLRVVDVKNSFRTQIEAAYVQVKLSDQLIDTILAFVSKNISASFANSTLLSTMTFAMVFGAVAGRNFFTKSRRVNYLYLTLLQLRNTFFLAMEWVIFLTPVAVVSLIAGAMADNSTNIPLAKDVYMFLIANCVAAFLHMMVLYPIGVFLLARRNPYTHMLQMVRAYAFALACSSSLATAPVTLACVRKAKVCSLSLANFVISLGVCCNASASGWYFSIGVIFLAESSGIGDQITALRIFTLVVLSAVASAGTPPIPAGGLVVTVTMFKTVFGVDESPATYPFLLAMNVFVDRLATVCNVSDDIMALKVIAENTDETVTAEYLGERF